MNSSKGFTLVELSIVMIIIGLLIGGILKGQELVQNARVRSDISMIKTIDTAMLTFYDIYKTLPGDLRLAQNFIPGCAAGSTCSPPVSPNYRNQGNGVVDFPCVGSDFFLSEERLFFSHLAAANLINAVKSIPTAPINPGDSIPKSQTADGMLVLFTGTPRNIGGCSNGSTTYGFNEPSGFRNFASSTLGNTGHYIVLGAFKGFTFGVDPLGVNPSVVSKFDKILDDGLPYSGVVQVGNLNGRCAETYPTNRYKIDSGGMCETLIKLNSISPGQ